MTMMNDLPLIVWVDEHANDSMSSFRIKLSEDEHQRVKMFNEIDSCIKFVEININETIFFILSGSFGSKLVPMIYDYKHIYQIYLFCGSIASHTSWAIDYTEKMFMFDHEDDLLRRLFKEIEEYLRKQAEQYLQQANLYKERAKQFKQNQCG